MSPAEHKLLMKMARLLLEDLVFSNSNAAELRGHVDAVEAEQKERMTVGSPAWQSEADKALAKFMSSAKPTEPRGFHSVCRDGMWINTPMTDAEIDAEIAQYKKLQNNSAIMAQPIPKAEWKPVDSLTPEISDPAVDMAKAKQPTRTAVLANCDERTCVIMERTHDWNAKLNSWVPKTDAKWPQFVGRGTWANRQSEPRGDRPTNPDSLTKEHMIVDYVAPNWIPTLGSTPRPTHYVAPKRYDPATFEPGLTSRIKPPAAPTMGEPFHFPPYWSAMNDQQRQRYMYWLEDQRMTGTLK